MKNPATQGSFERDPDFGAAVVVSAGAFIGKNISTLFSIFIWKEFLRLLRTVVSHSDENFSFKWDLTACLFHSTKKDWVQIGYSHLNKTFSFEYDANTTGQITNLEKAYFP